MTTTFSTIQKTFLRSPFFAVVGASKDQNKFGTKVLNWYKARSFNVTPIHLKEKELEGLETLRSITELPSPTETSISIITPPKVTLGILEQAKELSIPYIWLQPGAEDEDGDVVNYIKESGLSDRVIYGGPCILEHGDAIRSLLGEIQLILGIATANNAPSISATALVH